MAKKLPPKKLPPKKQPVKAAKKEVTKDSKIELMLNFEKERFCPKCGKVIDNTLDQCNICKIHLKKIDFINNSDESFKELAITALTDSDIEARKNAVDSLGDSDNLAVLGVLTYLLLNDPNAIVRREAADELGDLAHNYSISPLEKAMKDKSAAVRQEAAAGLKKIRQKREKIRKKAGKKSPEEIKKQRAQAKKERIKQKSEVTGSERIGEKIKDKTPWIFGAAIHKPKIRYPAFKHRKFSVPMPGKTLALIGIYIILFVLQTGVVYLIYKEPPALGADSNGDAIFLYPSIHDSFIVEGIVASLLIFVCSSGFLILYQASKHSYNKKLAIRYIVIGVIMIFGTFIALQYMIAVKTGNVQAWW